MKEVDIEASKNGRFIYKKKISVLISGLIESPIKSNNNNYFFLLEDELASNFDYKIKLQINNSVRVYNLSSLRFRKIIFDKNSTCVLDSYILNDKNFRGEFVTLN